MSANAPWSVKGIDAKAREVAKDLARRSGMTLGEWLNQMILQGEDVGALISKERARERTGEQAQPQVRQQPRTQARPAARGYAPQADYDDEDEPLELTPARRGPPYRDETPRRPAAAFSSGALASRDLRRRSIFEAPSTDERPRYDDGYEPEGNELSRVARALENLGSRIETSETRSAGAVRGVSHAVESLLSRLERSEAVQAETQAELQARLDEQNEAFERLNRSTEAQGSMAQRLERAQRLIDAQAERLEGLSGHVREERERLDRLEKQAVAPQVADTVRAVEGALGKLANQLYEGDVRTRDALRDVREDMVGLSHRLAQIEVRDPERAAQGAIDKVVAQLAQRLEAAEAQTTGALKTLEQAFTALDGRLNRAEERGDVTDPQSVHSLKSLAADLQRKLEDSRAEVLNTLQGQTQASIEQAVAALGERIEQSEKRQAQAIERMGLDVVRVADTLNRRMGEVAAASNEGLTRVGQEIGRVAGGVETRFSRSESSHAQALERLGNEIARISERLSSKLGEQERRTAEVLNGVGEQVEQTTRHVRDDLETRIRDSEARTQKLLEDTRARIDQRLAQTFQSQALQARGLMTDAPQPDDRADGLPNPFAARAAQPETETQDELDKVPFSRLAGGYDSPAAATADDEEEIDLTGRLLQPAFADSQFKPEFDPFEDDDLDGDLEPATHAQTAAPVDDDADPFADIDHSRKISPRSASPLAGRQARQEADDYGEEEGANTGRERGFEGDDAVSVSTRDALAAARAAVRAAAMDAPARGPLGGLKPGANRSRTPPEPRPRDGSASSASTFSQAVKASAVAVGAVAVLAGGAWFMQQPRQSAKPAAAPAADDTPIAAAVLAPEAGLSAEYNEAAKLIEAKSPGAIDRMKMVANQGYAPAQELLGEIYYSGKDGLVSPDKAQAREWTEKAAHGGMAKAMRLLAQMYYNGQGVETDPTMAAVWMRRAADRGDVNSAYNLGLLYQSGTGVPMNPTEAYKWMMIATKLGDPEAPATAAQLKKQLTDPQVAKVHDEVENFKPLTDGEPLNASTSGSASASNG